MENYWSLILYGIGGILATSVGLLVAFQEKLIYVPVVPGLTKSYPITPARLRLLYEDVWLRSSDGVRLHAWFIKLAPDCRGLQISLTDFFYPLFLCVYCVCFFALGSGLLLFVFEMD